MTLQRLTAGAVSLVALASAGSCDEKGISYGDANSLIAVMAPERWAEVAEPVYEALEPRITTVRDEKTFTVTYQEPYSEHWDNLRRFRQLLLVGTPSDPWMQEAIEQAPTPITEPGVHQIREVWARDQTATLVVLPEENGNEELIARLPELNALLDGQYRAYVGSRMYVSGVDSALADTLSMQAGFRVLVPHVYRWRSFGDSVYVLRNDNPDPSELIREVTVTWTSPAPVSLDAEDILAWRAQLVEEHFPVPQDLVREGMATESFEGDGMPMTEVRAQWRNPPDVGWPAGGPTITRALTCDSQDRTYLLDGWLYAPGKEKYEYLIQLETILDTFRCES